MSGNHIGGEAPESARIENARSVFLAAQAEITQLLDRASEVVKDPHYEPSEVYALWNEIRRIDDERVKPALQTLDDLKK